MNLRRFWLAAALFLSHPAAGLAQEPLVLLAPVATLSPARSVEIVRQRRVDVPGAARLMSAEASRELRLDLFPDVSLLATRRRLEPTANGMSWVGVLDGYPLSDVVFVQVGDQLVGNVFTPFGVFRLAREGGAYVVQQLDEGNEIHDVNDAVIPPDEALGARTFAPALASPDNGGLIDVMVVYTRDALAGFGGETAARAAIDLVVAETNQAFRNSDINSAIRLAHSQVIEYEESGTSATDLSRLQSRTDGFMDDVHALRDRVGADLVVLITERMSDAAGRGYLSSLRSSGESGFSTVARRSTTTGRTFAHELGHNLGAHHDWFVESAGGAFRSAKGYTSVPGRFLDVMAYFDHCQHLGLRCVSALQYSNPRTFRDGHPTGIAEGTKVTCTTRDPEQVDCDADSAGALNRMIGIVARFRQGSRSIMSAGQQLAPGESIASEGGAYRLVYQSDGNLVLYDERSRLPVWASQTGGTRPGRVVMQNDGNLVLIDGDGVPRWATGSNGTPFAYLLVQNDGNVVIYAPEGGAIWDRFRR